LHDKAVIFGNYAITGQSPGYGNDAMTARKTSVRDSYSLDWYDWFDDLSYQSFRGNIGLIRLSGDCDPPFTGENAHAASQSE
jgi:hypothetical protein